MSGITANPTIGVFSDRMTAMGGTTILTEVPEMFGAETILMNRCESEALFNRTVRLINDFKAYFESYHMPVYENPSPGNKAGGISTLEDKALGCTQKSGSSAVKGVLAYGEPVSTAGLNLRSAARYLRSRLPATALWHRKRRNGLILTRGDCWKAKRWTNWVKN